MEKETTTSIKTEANNAIYTSLMEMLKDGQQIFKNDMIMKKKFTFSCLVTITFSERPASLKGKIINDLKKPVEGAAIMSQDQKYTTTTDKKGHYHIKRITAAMYTFTVTCPGYNPFIKTITFVAGKISIGDFELNAALLKVA